MSEQDLMMNFRSKCILLQDYFGNHLNWTVELLLN
ncbi:hypothetical protein BVRB_3g049260 [Beta vulgaris subsp. vulgaris]|nr:hypothetical protein BVRB_3g049260 [Beta vulgaris subsp. vulgaris]